MNTHQQNESQNRHTSSSSIESKGPRSGMKMKKLALAALFGVAVSVSKFSLPTPLDKILVIFQALFLTLSFLLLGITGATLVATIGGFLTALWRAPFALFTIGFAVLYGLLIDLFLALFRVRSWKKVKAWRLVLATALATSVTGLITYFVTIHIFALLPRSPILEFTVLAGGGISGAAGGYMAFHVWKRGLCAFIMR